MAVRGSDALRVALVGPREAPFEDALDLEYRERMIRSYEDIVDSIAAFGSDYTASREFLGIEYLAASLREHGRQVLVVSASNENVTDAELVRKLRSFDPDLVGLSLLYDLQLVSALRLAKAVKEFSPRTHVVFGGPLASAIADLLLSTFPFVDSVVQGEGEISIEALAKALEHGTCLEDVPALVHRGASGLVHNRRGAPVDLNSLPHPSRDVIGSILERGRPVPSAYLTMSRGCKAFCTFCTVPNIVRGMKEAVYRARDPVDVVDEIQDVIETYGVRRFYMADDNFLGYGDESNQRMLEFADEIIRRKVDINFHAECRVDSLVPETLIRLREAGFDQILYGLESGSQKTLKRWAKGQTVEQNEAAVVLARNLKLDLMPSMILLDWESEVDELEESIAFIERNQLYATSQPLWLVNKLKVHCGTAASRRYDNVRGKPSPPRISEDDESLYRWASAVTYQGIPIENRYVAAFWTALNAESNRWTYLLDDIIPAVLRSIHMGRRNEDHQAQIAIVRQIGIFRRSVGATLAKLMRYLIDLTIELERSGAQQPDMTWLARTFVDEREACLLGYSFSDFLRGCCQQRRYVGVGAPGMREARVGVAGA